MASENLVSRSHPYWHHHFNVYHILRRNRRTPRSCHTYILPSADRSIRLGLEVITALKSPRWHPDICTVVAVLCRPYCAPTATLRIPYRPMRCSYQGRCVVVSTPPKRPQIGPCKVNVKLPLPVELEEALLDGVPVRTLMHNFNGITPLLHPLPNSMMIFLNVSHPLTS